MKSFKKTIKNISRLYETVSYSTLLNVMKEISKKNDEDVRVWKSEETIHCGGNLDARSKVWFEGDRKCYHDSHMYSSQIFKAGILLGHPSDIQKPDTWPRRRRP